MVLIADRLRIVTFSPGGRPIVELDLADQSTLALQRDTPAWSPPAKRQEWSSSSNRYGGARLAHEAHDNGSFQAQWYIKAATADLCLAARDSFWTSLESIAPGRYLEYRPDSASRSSYCEIRGTAPWADQYRWIEFAQTTPTLGVQAGFTTAPLWEGERMLIDDPFDVNSLTDYTVAHGTTLTYGAAACTTASTTEWDMVHTGRGYPYGDAQVTVVYHTGGTVTGGSTRAILSWIDDNNYLYAEVTGTTVKIFKKDGGTPTQLATTTITAIAINTTYTVAIREEGNSVIAEHWVGTPTLGSPTNTATATLSGGDATKFGFGSTGKAGLGGTWATPSGWQINRFSTEPYTYVGRVTPQTIQLGGAIPGTAPAKTTVAYSFTSNSLGDIFFGVFGWAGRGTAPFGLVEGESGTATSNCASAADANAHGGNYMKATTVSGSGGMTADFSVSPTLIDTNLMTSNVYVLEVWGNLKTRITTGGTMKVVTSYVSPENTTSSFFYASEFGSTGQNLLVDTTSPYYMFTRLGTFIVPTGAAAGKIRLAMTWTGAGASSDAGIDYLLFNPAAQRGASATGPGAGAVLFPANAKTGTKFIDSTLLGATQLTSILPVTSTYDESAAPGLGGAPIEIAPGNTDVLFVHGENTPDNGSLPALNPDTTAATAARLAVHPIPRYFVPRGS